MSRSAFNRILVLLLLLIAGVEAYACDRSDACVPSSATQTDDCDQPLGDNCLCCCHHVVPVTVFALQVGATVCEEATFPAIHSTAPVAQTIDHPPQL